MIPRDPNAPLPSVPLDRLAGSYAHPAYGSIELCNFLPNQHPSDTPTSATCRETISTLAHFLQGGLSTSDGPRFVASFSRAWLTHLEFTHFAYNTFNITAWNIVRPAENPTSRDKSEEPFIHPSVTDELLSTLTFDVGDPGLGESGVVGFGLRGVWGSSTGVDTPDGDSVRERAEVWFQRTGH